LPSELASIFIPSDSRNPLALCATLIWLKKKIRFRKINLRVVLASPLIFFYKKKLRGSEGRKPKGYFTPNKNKDKNNKQKAS